MPSVRAATSSDAGAIASLLRDAFVEYQPQYTPAGYRATTPDADQIVKRLDEGPVWIATRDGRVDGTVSAVLRDDGVYVRGMAVAPAARGTGVARLLLQCVHDFALAHRQRRLLLSTTPFLVPAIQLYEQQGFVRTDAPPHDLFGTSLFTMEKTIV